jgi:hypothetical protein
MNEFDKRDPLDQALASLPEDVARERDLWPQIRAEIGRCRSRPAVFAVNWVRCRSRLARARHPSLLTTSRVSDAAADRTGLRPRPCPRN